MTDIILTAKQRAVVDGVLRGLCNKEIAGELGVSISGVKVHLAAVARKFGTSNRVLLACSALKLIHLNQADTSKRPSGAARPK